MKHLILHYHLFKNGGTSLDAILKGQFPGAWVTKEFDGMAKKRALQLASWIASEEHAVVFSSHTAWLPTPELAGVNIIPLIFVRHPIDRIASAYAFERKLKNPSNDGAKLAQRLDFRNYVLERLLDKADRQCRNFQTRRLSEACSSAEPERPRALKAVEALPFVGVVEEYEKSMLLLNQVLRPYFPAFNAKVVQANQGAGRGKSLEARLEEARDVLGEDVYKVLLDGNDDDLMVHQAACKKLRAHRLVQDEDQDLCCSSAHDGGRG